MGSKERSLFVEPDGDNGSGIMRAVVINRVDPTMEGRIQVTIPRVIPDGDPGSKTEQTKTHVVNTEVVNNEEMRDVMATNVTSTNGMWARPMQGHTGNFLVPYVGQTVYVTMEDGDPSKLYYYTYGPTISSQVISFKNIRNAESVYTPEKRPNLHVLHEFKDGTTIYLDENEKFAELRIFFGRGGHSFSMKGSENFQEIEMITKEGYRVLLDEFNKQASMKTPAGHLLILSDAKEEDPNANKDTGGDDIPYLNPNGSEPNMIMLKTSGGSFVKMDGEGDSIITQNKSGSTISMVGDNITTKNKSGSKVVTTGGTVTVNAGGGKIVVGGGKVQLN